MSSLMAPAARVEAPARVAVHAPGRLHLGFLDPSATLGRRFGSIGLVIDGFETALELAPAARDQFSAGSPAAEAELDRAAAHLHRLRERTGIADALSLRLAGVLPAHAGFGSGTQLALAVGRAFARLHGLQIATPQLAAWLGRGLRSGIGIAGFDEGGLIVDGGPGAGGTPAPVLCRLPLPADWRVIVVQDLRVQGLSGDQERAAIARLAPLAQPQAADLAHQVLMRLLPGAADGAFEPFAAGLNRVQQLLGEHFAPAQDGSAWTSAAVGRLLDWARPRAAVGQSSWGPTGFAIVPGVQHAQALLDAARAAGVLDPALTLHTVAARNRGARIEDSPSR